MAITNFLAGKIVSLKDDGTVNAGGKVTFYVADGTFSTTIATYTDKALTVPNTVPIILDAAGRAKAYFTVNADVRILTSTDVLVYSERDISPQNVKTVYSKSSSFAIDSTYADSVIEITAALTATIDSAATLGAGFSFTIVNTAAVSSTLARANAGDTINGTAANLTIQANSSIEVTVNSGATGFLVDTIGVFPVTIANGGTGSTTAAAARAALAVPGLTTNNTMSGNQILSGNVTLSAKSINDAQGANLASAATTDIWTQSDGNTIHVTGTASINSFGTAPQIGAKRHIIADGAFTIVPGANITGISGSILCAVGDTFDVYANNSTTVMAILNFNRASGAALNAPAANITGSLTSSQIGSATVGQAQLKYTSGELSTVSTTLVNITLPGGITGFYPMIRAPAGSGYWGGDNVAANASWTAYVSGGTQAAYAAITAVTATMYMLQAYVTASPPYNLGDGDIPLFIFAEINPSGQVVSAYCAPEAPWHYNGPTSVKAVSYRNGKSFQNKRQFFAEHGSIKEAIRKGMTGEQATDELAISPLVEVEITQAIKNSDMALIPHPFVSKAPGNTIILIDPVSLMCEKLCSIHESGESVLEILNSDYITIGSKVDRFCPPGVDPVSVKWKLTK